MTARIAPPLCAALALAGCTNDRPVETRAVDGGIEFVTEAGAAESNCVSFLRVGHARKETLWEIEALNPDRTQVRCAARLPVRYGVAPSGFRTTVAAKPLTPGKTYDLIGDGDGFLRAAFRYDGPGQPVVNFRPNSAEWCAVQYPGSAPDWLGNCRVR